MAEPPPDPQDTPEDVIDDLREDIELNTGLLASLEDGSDLDSETEESKKVIRKTLKRLNRRLRALTQPEQNSSQPHMDGATDDMSADAGRGGRQIPPSSCSLVNRKRQRGDFDDDVDSRDSKSRRASPALSASGPSPVPSKDSIDDIDIDSAFLTQFMSREELEEQREYLKGLEERKRQELADQELALKLWNDSEPEPVPSSSAQRPVPASSSQSFFRGDGSFKPVRQDSAAKNLSKPSQERPVVVDDAPSSDAHTPASSEDSLEEIAASMFTPRLPQNTAAPPGGMIMLGDFPGARHPYINQAGASVYNNVSLSGRPGYLHNSGADAVGGANLFGANLHPNNMSGYARNILNNFQPWADVDADPLKTAEEIKDLLKHIRPDEELTDEQLAEMPSGLTRPLMPHQISGLAWMKKMEEGTNKGGLLADDMGLGKTVQAIALMLARPAPENDKRPNLVVAPVALMHQWERELDKFVHRRSKMNVIVMHGPGRADNYSAIRHADVVITTYGTLASELKRRIVYENKCKHAADPSSVKDNCAILGNKSKFHRVFLDEAQNIKNRNTKTAIAACRIAATHRWALTGTPMQNNVEEMYSLIKFTRIRPYCDWDKFSRDVSRPLKGRAEALKDRAMKTLQALLRAVLLRRTKQSKINGNPIIQLPEKHTIEERAIMDTDQKQFYEALEKQSQIQFNRYLRNGSVGRNYSHALVLLLRLRQACCHPTLIVNSKDFQQTVSDLAPMDMAENAKLLSDNVIDRLKRESLDGFECPVCMDAHENPTIFQCGHAICADCLAKLCDAAVSSEEGSHALCPQCRAKIDPNTITDLTSFLRVYCPERDGVDPLDDLVGDDNSDTDGSDEAEDDSDDGADLADFVVADDEPVEYDDADDDKSSLQKPKRNPKKASRGRGKGKGKQKDKNISLAELRKAGLRSKSAKKKYLRQLSKNWVTSAKIDKTIEILEAIHARGDDEKTIIFSSFTSFLDLLEVPLSRHPNFGVYSRYDGSMTSAARNDAVLDFEKPQTKIILVSLKAGNAGLNLTAANHVILLDPFWNPFVEYQAADRCYRIGQEREVTIHRVLIGCEGGIETVEDRILQLQEKKRHLVETALDENAGSQLGRLGVRELGYLFGVNSL